jgi:hypothetical protein
LVPDLKIVLKNAVKQGQLSFPYKKFFTQADLTLLENFIPDTSPDGNTLLNKDTYNIDVMSDIFQEEERVKCVFGTAVSPIEFWKNIDFDKMSGTVDTKYLRQFIFYNTKECNQFKPTVALWIAKKFNSKRILDFSAGWGDRLLAALVNANVERYLGFDPNINLKKGHDLMIDGSDKAKIVYIPFEDAVLNEKFDLVLTSPPYFDLEKYTGTKQSIDTFKTFDSWLNNFLLASCEKSYNSLINGGYMCIHIKDFEKYKIVDPLKDFMKSLGAVELPELYSLGKSDKKMPIWCWQKPI